MPIGTTLMEMRRQRGLRIADIEATTHIMGSKLSALENGRWEELPAPAYVKGYITGYASAMGVDPAPLLAEYERDRGLQAEHDAVKKIPHRAVVPPRLEIHAVPRRVWIALAVAVVLIGLVIWGASALLGGDKEPAALAPESTATVTPGQGEPFALAINVSVGQSSWIQVLVDGLVVHEGTMQGGNGGEWTVSQSAVVRIANPGAVTVTRDGAVVTLPAPVDGVAELTLTTAAE